METGVLEPNASLPNVLEERLSWEAFAELTFRSQSGQTLEKAGLVSVHPEMAPIRDAVRAIKDRARDKLGDGFEVFSEEEWRAFMLGVVERMRLRGAVLTDLTRDFLDSDAVWFALLRRTGREYKLPYLHPRAPRPAFPASRFAEGYDSVVASGSSTSWYGGWADKIFLSKYALAASTYPDLYFLAFDALAKSGLIEKRDMGARYHNGAVWGLLAEPLKVWQDTATLRCDRCGHSHQVPNEAEEAWDAVPCTKLGCEGLVHPAEDLQRKAYFERIFGSARIRRVVAREHTGLLDRDTRTRIERGFMKPDQDPWDPNILSATSTLEMGIDIGDLSTLALCSVPPEQANYVQRIGRTGRRDGNSLNLTIATGRPHDLYFWAEPKEMIAGAIKTPGVYLKAFAILKRQFAAYTLDRWNKETTLGEGEGYGTLRTCFENIQLADKKLFPLSWYGYVESNVEGLLSDFVGLFPELAAESRDTIDRLAAFARGEDGGFTAWIADEFQQIKNERDDLLRQIKKSENENRRIKKLNPPPQDKDDQLAELRLERKSLRALVKEIERKDVLGFLTEHGILPNYAFPEEGIHLKSVIYRLPQRGKNEELETTVYEYARSASAGLSDFAPPSRFYAEGHQVRIDEINLDLSEIETWRVCPSCTYMERIVGEETEKPCPSCESGSWRDNSQKRDFIRLRQVIAVTDARRARIGDDSDEREIHFFDRSLFPSFTKEAIEEAFSLADAPLPFGFEYIRNCNFREINFGEPREGQGAFKAAGHDARGGGFQICRHCHKIQGIRRERGVPDHKPRCPARDGGDPEDFLRIAYLYREFPSEAIRILMPISALDADKGVQSFISGLNLGLRLHFEGKVDHLRTTMLEAPEGLVTRRYLYVYDSVPGGTGYLKQLMTTPDDFREIFEKALHHMQGCSCNADPKKDGCYRCIYAYRDASRMEKTSRSHAVAMFAAIVESWPSLETVGSIGDIQSNALLESELEAMFVLRLEQMAKDAGGTFRTVTVNGKKGYFLKLGKDAPAWEIEPQVWLNERYVMPVKTRADFVMSPKPSTEGLKPIAIYVDGWEHHYDRIGGDFEKRLAVIRTGQCLVWSLSYNDLAKESASNPQERIDHLWNPFAGIEMNFEKFFSSGDCEAARKLAAAPPPKVLEAYLTGSDVPQWNEIPKILSLATLLAPSSEKKPEAIEARVNAAGGGALQDFLEELAPEARFAMIAKGGFAFVAGMPTPPDLARAQPLILLDDSGGNTPLTKEAWNTALRIFNLTQFSPWVHAAPHSHPHMPLPQAIVAGMAVGQEGWQELYDLVPEAVHTVLDKLRDAGVEPPVVGYELMEGNRIVAEAELAWEEGKIAVAYPEHIEPFQRNHWNVLDCRSVVDDPAPLISAFKQEKGA